MSNTIKSITVINVKKNISYHVTDKEPCMNPNQVDKILDLSQEYEDSTEFIYQVFNHDKKLIACIENCPVIIEYKI